SPLLEGGASSQAGEVSTCHRQGRGEQGETSDDASACDGEGDLGGNAHDWRPLSRTVEGMNRARSQRESSTVSLIRLPAAAADPKKAKMDTPMENSPNPASSRPC